MSTRPKRKVSVIVILWFFVLLTFFLTSSPVLAVVYVNKNATGANNGNSWTDAYTTIQAGIDDADAADEEVWVAQGTYLEAIVMKSGVNLYGGFSGTETSRSQRNWMTNVTTIDGSTARGGSPAYHVVIMDAISNSAIDGFTITGGVTDVGLTDNCGAGIYCESLNDTNMIKNNTIMGNSADMMGGGIFCLNNSSPAIINNTIFGNTAFRGSGIYCDDSSPAITNNTISGNTASGDFATGGGISCYSNSSATIAYNTISDNLALGYYADGGGIYGGSILLTITNNIISKNYAGKDGGGIFIQFSPTVSNNVISGNLASWGGGVCCSNFSFPSVNNNIISGNRVYGYGAGIYCEQSSAAITNNTISHNSAQDLYGGGICCYYYSSPQITNNIFSYNDKYDIYEDGTSSDPSVSYNNFYGNSHGVYYDEGTTPYTSVAAMDGAISECSNNIGVNPVFLGDTLSGGTWTASPSYNAATFQTTLTDSSASWTTDEHVGRLLNPDTSQSRQFVIASNTATIMNVWGDATSIAQSGDPYNIFDYHLQSNSPCIDAGCFIAGLTSDFEGDVRPYDGTSEFRGDGSDFDIGADEFSFPPTATSPEIWSLYE